MWPAFTYVRPASLREALEELDSPGSRIHAGGTDLLGCLRDGVFGATRVVAIGHLAELGGISVTGDGGLRIGALTTLAGVAASRVVTERYRALAEAAASAASPQLRNQGTLGGNLCQRPRCWYFRGDFPCLRKGGDLCSALEGQNEQHAIFGGEGCVVVHPSDTAPALVALEAKVRLVSRAGSRIIPVESFFVLPERDVLHENVLEAGEILTDVLLPPQPEVRSSYRKARARAAWDFALAGVALALRIEDGRLWKAGVVLSGVAPIPWRAREAEAALIGARLDPEAIARAASASIRGARPLEHNTYKVDLVRGLVEEALLALA